MLNEFMHAEHGIFVNAQSGRFSGLRSRMNPGATIRAPARGPSVRGGGAVAPAVDGRRGIHGRAEAARTSGRGGSVRAGIAARRLPGWFGCLHHSLQNFPNRLNVSRVSPSQNER
jgi:hypothetical protein